MECLVKFFAITSGQITVSCDNGTILAKCFDKHQYPNIRSSHQDLIRAVQAKVEQCPVTFVSEQFKGHQDDLGQPLTFTESLNVEMDILAKSYWQATHSAPDRVSAIEDEPWSLYHNGFKIPCLLYTSDAADE